jgi:excisionase family DNA binding protein
MPDPTPEPLLLRDTEAAALLGIGRSTLRRLLCAGKVPPPIHLGRSCRWRRAELLAWLEAGAPDARMWAAIREQQARRLPRVVG